MTIRYGSVCSGAEAASVAWEPLGWRPQWFAEVDKFPADVLAHHWPDVPNLGDMTGVRTHELATDIDLLVGGTPCQSFSVAGLRKGLDDERGNLALEFCRIADAKRPRWIVWENVPGVLSSDRGRAFGSILGALADIGYRLAWRVLDAQHFGVPQRRRRVFLVGHLGGAGNRAAEVLFESEGVPGHPPSREEARQETSRRSVGGADGHRESLAFHATQDPISGPVAPALGGNMYVGVTVPPIAKCLTTGYGKRNDSETETWVTNGMRVRKMTPRECERLQGFPDDHTLISWRGKHPEDCPDGHRYKAMGNSMAVPVMRWIGERIQRLDDQ